jgi:hypothetical protein
MQLISNKQHNKIILYRMFQQPSQTTSSLEHNSPHAHIIEKSLIQTTCLPLRQHRHKVSKHQHQQQNINNDNNNNKDCSRRCKQTQLQLFDSNTCYSSFRGPLATFWASCNKKVTGSRYAHNILVYGCACLE